MKDTHTKSTKQSEIVRTWHLIDLKDQTLGRVAGKVAQLLMGKSKPYFVRNLDSGDYVVAINAKEIAVSGNKEKLKNYYRHSGYPGGFRQETLQESRIKHPERIITHAVKGMLPQNKLRDKMLTRFFVFEGATHKYEDKFKVKSEK